MDYESFAGLLTGDGGGNSGPSTAPATISAATAFMSSTPGSWVKPLLSRGGPVDDTINSSIDASKQTSKPASRSWLTGEGNWQIGGSGELGDAAKIDAGYGYGSAEAGSESPERSGTQRNRHVAFDILEDSEDGTGTNRTQKLRNADMLHSADDGAEPGHPRVFRNRRNSKLFWMDDSAAKACCNCEAPFTMLLRRHHCRACGFIFCGSCTTKRLDGADYGLSGQVRVCDECYNYAKRVKDGLTRDERHHMHRLQRQGSTQHQSELEDYVDDENDDDDDTASRSTDHKDLSNHHHHHPHHFHHHNHNHNHNHHGQKTGATHGNSSTQHQHSSRHFRRDHSSQDAHETRSLSALAHYDDDDEEDDVDTNDEDNTRRLPAPPSPPVESKVKENPRIVSLGNRDKLSRSTRTIMPKSGRASSRRLLEPMDLVDILNMDDDGTGAAGVTRLGPSRFSKRATMSRSGSLSSRLRSNSWDGKPREKFDLMDDKMRSSSFKRNNSQTQLSDPPQSVNNLIKEHEVAEGSKIGDKEALSRFQKDLLTKRLDRAVQRLVTKRVSSLRDKRPSIILSEDVQSEWKNTLTRISKQFCGAVRPYNMDFDGYCKLVSIPGGSISECTLLNGVICDKHVVHRLMRQHIVQPRILLLEGAIEFSRERNRISSLDTLREQERHYMELVVHKITSMGVDLLLVGSSVSRIAQRLLLDAGVSVVINVQMRLLERISRLTGAYVLPNTDLMSILPNNADSLDEWDPRGTCKVWTMRTFSTKLTEAQKGEQLEQITPRTMRGPPRKTFMFFEGCPPRLGASICLRGASPTTLRHMEAILTSMITTTYTMKQQNRLFRDIGVYIGEDRIVKPSLLLQEDHLLEADYIQVCKVSICEKDQMHPAETKSLSFGTIGSDLTLGDYLRYRCFKTAPSVQRQRPSTSAVTSNGAAAPAATGVTPRVPGQTQDSSSGLGNSTDGTGTLGNDSNTNNSSNGSRAIGSSQLNVKGRNPTEGTEDVDRPTTGVPQDNSGAAGEFSQGFESNDFGGPFGAPAGVADAVFCVDDGRVYVFTGSLNKNDETHASLRDSLANIRREYVASGIRRLQNSESNRRSRALPIKNLPILTWSECLKCDAITEYKVLSKDAESLSFARWLQIKLFYRARNVSSLLASSVSPCKHSIFQDYVTYFELKGQVAGFEYENLVPYETSLYAVDPEVPRCLPNYAERWVTETLRLKRDELVETLRAVEQAFLDKKLYKYVDEFGPSEACHARAEQLVQDIRLGLEDMRKCLKQEENMFELNILELYRIRRDVIRRVERWNKELGSVRDFITEQSLLLPPRNDMGRSRTFSDGDMDEVEQSAMMPSETSLTLEALSAATAAAAAAAPTTTPNKGEYETANAIKSPQGDGQQQVEGDDEEQQHQLSEEEAESNGDELAIDHEEHETLSLPEPLDLSRSASVPLQKLKTRSGGLPTHRGMRSLDLVTASAQGKKDQDGHSFRNLQVFQENIAVGKLLSPVDLPLGFMLRGRPGLPSGFGNRVVFVYDEEPTSWIAYALNSQEHRQRLFALAEEKNQMENFQNGMWSQVMRAKLVDPKNNALTLDFHDSHGMEQLNLHFSVKVYCALHFHALRQSHLNWRRAKGGRVDPEISFLESLSRCDNWQATGGKSKSVFLKSRDGRFIAKSISSMELDMFLALAPSYFSHLANIGDNRQPSALLKIVGVYTVTSKEGPSALAQQMSSKVSSRLNLADLDANSVQAFSKEISTRSEPSSGSDSLRRQTDSPLGSSGERAAEALRVLQAPPTPPLGPRKAIRRVTLAPPRDDAGTPDSTASSKNQSDPLVDSALDLLAGADAKSFEKDDSISTVGTNATCEDQPSSQLLPRLTPTVGGLASAETSSASFSAKRAKGEIGIVRPVASTSAAAAAATDTKKLISGTSGLRRSVTAGVEDEVGGGASGNLSDLASAAGDHVPASGASATGSIAEKESSAATTTTAPTTERQASKTHYIIMENLFPPDELYEAKFDLKGNFRNRLVVAPKKGEVLLDRNFRAYTNGVPLSLTQGAKRELRETVERDTEFLEREEIVDYSLLLGIPSRDRSLEECGDDDGNCESCETSGDDGSNPVLQVGIIDFLQVYNLHKMIESNVKRAGMIAGQLEPTVIDPNSYRARFLRAVDRNFIGVPTHQSTGGATSANNHDGSK